MHRIRPAPVHSRPGRGFSLVEVLVVVGIIGILVAILLPAVRAARLRAESLACQAKLRTVGQAAELHVLLHRGYLPAAGMYWDLPKGHTVVDPKGIGDPDAVRYLYYTDDGVQRPAPVTAALASALGAPVRLESRAALEQDMGSDVVQQYFRCPSQAVVPRGLTQKGGDPYWEAPRDVSSYVFNEAILGRRAKRENPNPLMGRIAGVKQPSVVMFAMDGRPQDMTRHNNMLLSDTPNPNFTVWDYYVAALNPKTTRFGPDGLDFPRHQWRANVLFVDGHVESVPMTEGGLAGVGISKGAR